MNEQSGWQKFDMKKAGSKIAQLANPASRTRRSLSALLSQYQAKG
jgi:hypothetical protein